MERVEHKDGFIRTRRMAVIVLFVTGYIAALSFWQLLSDIPYKSHLLVPLDFLLPSRAVVAVNIGFYAYLLWLGVVIYRITRGKERLLGVGYFTGIVLEPIQSLV